MTPILPGLTSCSVVIVTASGEPFPEEVVTKQKPNPPRHLVGGFGFLGVEYNDGMKRIIAHLDMDAFFAAVEERNHPWLKGKPIVVGADPNGGEGRGVVSTASYKAREYGIHSAMPISKAWHLSEAARKEGMPPAVFLGTNHKQYSEVSGRVMEIIRKYAPVTRQASIDEMYLDLSFTKSFKKAKEICKKIKKEVREKEKLTASVGVGPNKLIAKIASDREKPNGLVVVTEEEIETFLEPLSIRVIPGIGPKTEALLAERGIGTVKNLKKISQKELEEMLGKWGLSLYEKARGRDHSPVEENHEVKSIGEQETFEKDTLDANFIIEHLRRMCESVFESLKKEDFSSLQTVVIAVRFFDFETKTRTHTLPSPVNSLDVFQFEAMKLLMPFLDKRENPRGKFIRLIGVRAEKLH